MKKRRGFTLIEMLVVIAIIGILASLIIGAVTQSLQKAKRLQCMNNMKGLASSMIQYSLKTRFQTLPIALDQSKPAGQWAWSYRLLDAGFFAEYSSVGELMEKSMLFRCPMDQGPGKDKPSFAMNKYVSSSSGTYAEFRYISSIPNTSNTILFAEVWGRRDNKGYTSVDENSAFAAFDRHNGLGNYAFVDGHATSIKLKNVLAEPDDAWLKLWRPNL